MIIKQKHYANIEVIGDEKDMVQLWFNEHDTNVVIVERESLPELISELQKEQNKQQ